jgi:hypothetical protein
MPSTNLTPGEPRHAPGTLARSLTASSMTVCILAAANAFARQPSTQPASPATSDTRISAVAAAPRAPLCDVLLRSLERRTLRIVEWSSAGLRVAPPNLPEELAIEAAVEVLPLDRILTIQRSEATIAGPQPSPPSLRRALLDQILVAVTLVDGQRFKGGIASSTSGDPKPAPKTDAPAESLTLETTLFGRLSIPFEQIAQVTIDQQGREELPLAPSTTAVENDSITLANGDTISGYIESVGTTVTISTGAVSTTSQSGGSVESFPLTRCASIRFANPPAPLEGTVAWIGTPGNSLQVIRADEFTFRPPGDMTLRPTIAGPSAPTATFSVDQLVAASPDAATIIPLATVPIVRSQPSSTRPWSQGPIERGRLASPLGLGRIELPGAMSVDWQIPAAATSLIGRISLSSDAVIWGDCIVHVELANAPGQSPAGEPTSLWSGRLHSQLPSHAFQHAFSAVPTGSVLRVRLESGEGGDVQDRVVLDGFMFILSPSK